MPADRPSLTCRARLCACSDCIHTCRTVDADLRCVSPPGKLLKVSLFMLEWGTQQLQLLLLLLAASVAIARSIRAASATSNHYNASCAACASHHFVSPFVRWCATPCHNLRCRGRRWKQHHCHGSSRAAAANSPHGPTPERHHNAFRHVWKRTSGCRNVSRLSRCDPWGN